MLAGPGPLDHDGGDRRRWPGPGRDRRYPYLEDCRERTIYYWDGHAFRPVARFGGSLIKLVPTEWGAPTFEIDGIKMLPTAQVSPYEDAGRKVALVEPRGKVVLDTCGGLGYFAAWCLAGAGRAGAVVREESRRDLAAQPESVVAGARDRARAAAGRHRRARSAALPTASVDAVLHDPPRFGIAGRALLAGVLRPAGAGARGAAAGCSTTPARRTRSPAGATCRARSRARLRRAGFEVRPALDGLVAVRG